MFENGTPQSLDWSKVCPTDTVRPHVAHFMIDTSVNQFCKTWPSVDWPYMTSGFSMTDSSNALVRVILLIIQKSNIITKGKRYLPVRQYVNTTGVDLKTILPSTLSEILRKFYAQDRERKAVNSQPYLLLGPGRVLKCIVVGLVCFHWKKKHQAVEVPSHVHLCSVDKNCGRISTERTVAMKKR